MTRDQLLADLRIVLDDRAVDPPLWDNQTLIRYLDSAVAEACIRGGLMRTTATQAVTAGTREYAMLASWYQILSARISTAAGIPLRILAAEVAESEDAEYQTIAGVPAAVVLEREGYYALTPVPDAAATITLVGFRVPTTAETLASAGASAAPVGVPAHRHADLVHWAAARAYQTRDADAGSLERAQYHDALFTRAFGPPVSEHLVVLRRRVRGYRVQATF
jgi:hypothetical protein